MTENVLKDLRIGVTGYDGFLGSYFVKTIRSLKRTVLLLEGDVRCKDTWQEKFDILYHFAAIMPSRFKENPEEAFSVNVDGVLNALGACRRNKAQMVFMSTCGVYKPGAGQVFSEDDPLEPPTAYTQSKFIGEMLCRSYAENYGVKSSVFRLFNVFGPGQDPRYIIPYLTQCVREGKMAEIRHPDSVRDFIYIQDTVDALLRAEEIKDLFRIYNVGSGKSFRISEVIELIGQICGKKGSYKRIDGEEDPHPIVCADVNRLIRELGWSAKTSFKDGIRDLVHHVHVKVN